MTRSLAALILLLGTFSSSYAGEAVTLRFGQIPSTVRGMTSLPRFVAEKRGLFARENLKVELVQIPGGTDKMVKALDRGEIDLTQTATPYLRQSLPVQTRSALPARPPTRSIA